MAYLPPRAEVAFEQHKEDGHVQAILTVLGKMREHVIDWSVSTRRGATAYKVVLSDGQEIRGDIAYSPELRKYVASGTLVPREVVQWEDKREVALTENEFYLLYSMLNDRCVQASKDGIAEDHDSQIFRRRLLEKMIPFLRKPQVILSTREND